MKQQDVYYYSEYGKTDPACVIRKNGVRISVLTSRLLRIEIQNGSVFCDAPTQCVKDRRFDKPSFTTEPVDETKMMIRTEDCAFCFDFRTRKLMSITLADGRTVNEYRSGNLGGTCRTLDGTMGKAKIGEGILSRNGVTVLNDSHTLTVANDGEIAPRKCNETDMYYFAYGDRYEDALRDYYRLTGFPPLIPRFALGNWWSRYKAYTQDEYMALIDKFREKMIPLTVATVDMDWHWVKVIDKFGKEAADKAQKRGVVELFYNVTNPGWTGYSWNTDLFPDHRSFLRWLKDQELHVTLNLHPASGCKFYEDAYADFCGFMGIDKESRQQIRFDVTDKKFMEGYFRFLHHPQEEDGVDFWWIDWQQGTKTRIPGLDPLWALNHYHYLDNGRGEKRPLILSRFAGAGSHRYPLGFSGDTAQNWSVLDFQPYFTATASNIGYTWWSHDIGGHHFGERDDELYLRWVQFGVFSPILRLHSTSNEFMGKEPWKYRADVELFASRALRFRHRLIPYLYSMNRLTHTEGTPLIRPMYYLYPNDDRAYRVPNEYAFGTQLIVCPITKKTDPQNGLAGADMFLPEGRFTDIFNGRIYTGDRNITMYRDEASIPVLAKEGAIIPLSVNDTRNTAGNPDALELLIYRGNGNFTLYEDDGETKAFENGVYCETRFEVSESPDSLRFSVGSAQGDVGVLPEKRDWLFSFRDIADCEGVALTVNGKPTDVQKDTDEGYVRIRVQQTDPRSNIDVCLERVRHTENRSVKELKIELISKLQGSNNAKNRFNRLLTDDAGTTAYAPLKGPLAELTALYYEST